MQLDTIKVSTHIIDQDDLQDAATHSLDVMDSQSHGERTATRNEDLPTSLDARKDEFDSIKISQEVERVPSPAVIANESGITMEVDMPNAPPEDTDVKSDSEAETIVLPGKDGHSPSKTRKSIKHEDKSDDEDIRKPTESRKRESISFEPRSFHESHLGRRKRLKSQPHNGNPSNLPDNRDSSHPQPTPPALRFTTSPSPPLSIRDDLEKAKSVDRAFPRDKRSTSDSGDDHVDRQDRKIARHRNSASNGMQSKESTPSLDSNLGRILGPSKNRSESPHRERSHKRSNSTQFPPKSVHSLSHRKGRIPPPLLSTEYQSDDSSASGRSHPRSSRPRQRAATAIGDSTMSYATSRKRDPSGATSLLKIIRKVAEGKGNVAQVIDELGKNPQDLNVGDHALTTPIHAATIDGHVEITKLLLSKGCIVDVANLYGDTPLHDAIENGHVEVVELLLEYGANPRKARQGGDEPIDIAAAYYENDPDSQREKREALQRLIEDAKIKTDASANTPLGDQTTGESADHNSYSKHSPRHSPASEYPTVSNRMRARSNKTTDQDLYRDYNKVDTLREACRSNDHQNISKWLDVNPGRKDAQSLLISAKAGDYLAVELLLGLGNFDRDPEPLRGEDRRWCTPMLCAIDKGHLDVIKCLLLGDFDPTRRWDKQTYHEIAQERERGSHNYEAVVETLKEAFNNYSKTVKSSPSKSRSPKLHRDADRGRDSTRPVRTVRDRSSPSRKGSPSKSTDKSADSQKGQHGNSSSLRQSHNAQNQTRRGPGRPRKEENNSSHQTSDTESAPLGPPKKRLQAPKVNEPDSAAMLSESERTKPRRKLYSGKELKGERDKQRRGSITSNVSTTSVPDRRGVEELKNADGKHKDTSIARPSDSTDEDHSSKHLSIETTSDKSERHDRIRGTTRDNSKDRLASIRNDKSPIKRQRRSISPPRIGTLDTMVATEADGAPSKRRKLEGLSKHAVMEEDTPSSSPDHPAPNLDITSSQDKSAPRAAKESISKISSKGIGEDEIRFNKENEEAQAAKKAEVANPADPERKKQAKLSREAREAKQQVKEAKEAKEAKDDREAKEAKKAREAKEIREAKEAEEAKQAKEQQAKQAKEAQELKEAQEKLVLEEEAAKRAQEEEDRKMRQAQDERDKAEQRRLYDEQKRINQEKLEQSRAAAQERDRLEKARLARVKEAERLAKLPPLLREFDQLPQAKTANIASVYQFRIIKGYRYDTMRPKETDRPSTREQWMLNTDVALLLGEKDLELSRCGSTQTINKGH